MKALLILFISTVVAAAQVPKEHNINKYQRLWKKSNITAKPDPILDTTPAVKNLDWALAGIMNHSDGNYTITLINKKDRNERRRVNTNGLNMREKDKEIRVVEVNQANGYDFKKSKVKITSHGVTAWVEYDQRILDTKPVQKVAAPIKRSGASSGTTRQTSSRSTSSRTQTSQSEKERQQLQNTRQQQFGFSNRTSSSSGSSSSTTIRRPQIRRTTPSK